MKRRLGNEAEESGAVDVEEEVIVQENVAGAGAQSDTAEYSSTEEEEVDDAEGEEEENAIEFDEDAQAPIQRPDLAELTSEEYETIKGLNPEIDFYSPMQMPKRPS